MKEISGYQPANICIINCSYFKIKIQKSWEDLLCTFFCASSKELDKSPDLSVTSLCFKHPQFVSLVKSQCFHRNNPGGFCFLDPRNSKGTSSGWLKLIMPGQSKTLEFVSETRNKRSGSFHCFERNVNVCTKRTPLELSVVEMFF